MSAFEGKPPEGIPVATEMPLNLPFVREAIRPLQLIFWGSLIVLFDFYVSHTVNGRGWRFDFLNDFAGMLMITFGVFRLGRIPVHARYKGVMTFVRIVAVLTAIEAFREHFIQPWPDAIHVLAVLVSVAAMAAMVLFCVAMRWFALESRLPRAARSWQVTIILMIAIYAVPLGGFYLVGLGALLTRQYFHINLGVFGLLLLPVFAVPLVFLLISTARMRKEAEALTAPPSPITIMSKPPPTGGSSS